MRKTIDVTISAETAPSQDGRDYGKVFRITEMSAFDAETWATKATLALIPRLTQQINEEIVAQIRENPSMLTLERLGLIFGGVSFPETKSLMDEIIQRCVQVVPDPGRPVPRPLNVGGSEDIEDVETLSYLRGEAMRLHTSFTMAAGILSLISAASMMSISPTTPTSTQDSPPSGPPVKRPSRSSRLFTH